MQFSIALVAAFAAANAAALPSASHVQHEKRTQLDSSWARHGSAPAQHVMPMRIALKQQNADQIPAFLDDVSNPKSKNYGKHWTGEELAQKFAPSPKTVTAVKSWLKEAGIKGKFSANKGWVEFESTIAQAEELLKTKYHLYKRDGEKKEHVGCDAYSVPGQVSEHIDFITPTVSMSELKRSLGRRQNANHDSGRHTIFTPVDDSITDNLHVPSKQFTSKLANVKAAEPVPGTPDPNAAAAPPSISTCAQGVTPACIRAMYNIPQGSTATMGNALGIYESMDYYNQPDLDNYFTRFAPYIENGTAPMLNSINGGLGPQTNDTISGESLLDLEVAYPLIHPQGVRLFQVDDPSTSTGVRDNHINTFLDALDAAYCDFMGGDDPNIDPIFPGNGTGSYNGTRMCGDYAPPTVLSISYGFPEYYFSPAYTYRQCLEFGKLGMAGTTVVASSGDSGVSAQYCANPKTRVATPQFPASCPYVTTVGATMLNTNVTDLADPNAEVAAHKGSKFQSGSGFSDTFAMPAYQQAATAAYLDRYYNGTLGNATMVKDVQFNSSGRAYPDIAAIGTNVTTFAHGKVMNADGTSASAPVFASMITLINELRIAQGKGPVGFVNPTLYAAKAGTFKDIKSGDNGGCGMAGFTAMEGWDPVTGLGTPIWDSLQALLLNV